MCRRGIDATIPRKNNMLILLCRNNMIARKNQGVNPWFSFFLDSFDALARVSWEPLAAPAMSLTSLRQIRSYGFSVFRAKRAKRPRPHWGLGGLAAASRSAFAPRGALSRFGPAPPRRSTSLNKRTRVKATPGFAALAFFFASRSRVSFCGSFACALSPLSWARVPPAGVQLSPLAFLAASLACALRASSRLSAAGLSLGRYRSRRSLCVFAAPPLFFCECFRCPFNHPPAPPILAGGARKLCAHFSPCDLICHCVHHRYTGVAMVH